MTNIRVSDVVKERRCGVEDAITALHSGVKGTRLKKIGFDELETLTCARKIQQMLRFL